MNALRQSADEKAPGHIMVRVEIPTFAATNEQ